MKKLKLLITTAILGVLLGAIAQEESQTQSTDNNGAAQNTVAAPPQSDNAGTAPAVEMPPPPPADEMDAAPPPQEEENQQSQNQPGAPGRIEVQHQTNSSATGNPADYVPPSTARTNGPSDLRLNFRNAPIEMVLNYLSDAAGFIIELDTRVSGRVDIWSNQPVTKDEAVLLLNSVLNKNGYAVVRNDRVLRVMNRDDALHSDIPVNVGNEPKSVPKTDEIVTQIIPIRFVEAKQLIADLSPLVSSRATIIANEAGNSIIVTDTQANIRHLMEVIKAIDTSAEDVTEVRVFHLEHHDPVEVANMLTSLFADSSSSTGSQTPIQFGGRNGGGGFGGGGPGGFFARMAAAQQGPASGNNANSRIKKRNRVVAVADQRTQSVVVTASRDLIDQIGDMVAQIDRESPKVSHVSVVHLDNADPQQVQQVLQDMFQNGNTRNTRSSSQNSPLMTRSQQATQSGTSSSTSAFGGNSGGAGGGSSTLNRSFGQ